MRKLGDMMKDLGFNKESSVDVQKAFIRHLVEAAKVSDISRRNRTLVQAEEQLSFDFEGSAAPSAEEILGVREIEKRMTDTPSLRRVGGRRGRG